MGTRHGSLLSLLRAGQTPTEDQRTKTVTSIAKLSAELSQVNIVISELEQRKLAIETELAYHRGLLAPVRQLPEELLREIFLLLAGGKVDVCDPRAPVWQIERVCRWWRGAALNLQELWSSVQVSMDSLTSWKARNSSEVVSILLDRCIERSGKRGLSIQFSESGAPKFFQDIFDRLGTSSARWESLVFSLSMLDEACALPNGAPRLRALGLSGKPRSEQPIELFSSAEMLTHLRFYAIPNPFATIRLPLHQVTHFVCNLCDFTSGEFVDMLRSMPRLSYLSLKWNNGTPLPTNPGSFIEDPSEIISLKHLRTLDVEATVWQCIALFEKLSVPRLRDLSLLPRSTESKKTMVKSPIPYDDTGEPIILPSSAGTVITGDHAAFLYLADTLITCLRDRSNSATSLTTLSLRTMDSHCAMRIVGETPGVRTLKLESVHDIPQVLLQLGWSGMYLPHLKSFDLVAKPGTAKTILGPLKVMVERRMGGLQSMTLALREKGLDGLSEMVKDLRGVGMRSGINTTVSFFPH